jgi:hypothetical protein
VYDVFSDWVVESKSVGAVRATGKLCTSKRADCPYLNTAEVDVHETLHLPTDFNSTA